MDRLMQPDVLRAVQRLKPIAEEAGLTLPQFALDDQDVQDRASRRIGEGDARGLDPGGRRRGDRAGPGQGRARGQGRRRGARHHAPVRGRREPRADHLARREGRARAGPPRFRAHPRRGGAEPVPGHPDHLRPGDRRRLLLRLRAAAERGPFTEEDLPAIEEEMRRIIAADKPLVREVWTATRRPRLLRSKAGRGVQGRVGDGAARGRADHHVPTGARRGRVDRPVPRAAPRLDRQARPAMRSS
jgi:hypothetical protein